MRARLAALALLVPTIAVAGCAGDVGSGVDEARSSAASVGAGIRSSAASVGAEVRSSAASAGAGLRSACRAGKDQLRTLDDLSGRLAGDADLRAQLAPQVRQTVDQLGTEIGGRDELKPVLAAGRDLTDALDGGDRTAIELSARQSQVAVRSAQALCTVAG